MPVEPLTAWLFLLGKLHGKFRWITSRVGQKAKQRSAETTTARPTPNQLRSI